jgi:uncharacterized protein (TIGR02300 family)
MPTTADIKAQRGTKRMCQNPECGSRFYDLNRDPITCPFCSTIYEIRVQPVSVAPARPTPRPVKKPAPFVPDEAKPDVPVEEGEEVVALEDAEEEVVVAADADETFLEPEEESSDVSGIIDAPVDDADEKSS